MKTKNHLASESGARGAMDPTTFTPEFEYRSLRKVGATLWCEEVALEELAREVGTPAYVYSRASIVKAYQRLDRAFHGIAHSLCYAVKANGNLSVLRLLAKLGSKFDVVSGGEIARLYTYFRALEKHAEKFATRSNTGRDAMRLEFLFSTWSRR
jgi:diaminopimelate decarboxylase